MTPPNFLYSGLLLAAGMICALVALLTWHLRRSSKGGQALVFFMLGLAWWDVTYAIFWAGVPGPTPYFWLDLTYLGPVSVPAGLLVFALQLTGKEDWVKPYSLVALMVEPIMVILALWTDPLHGLFFGNQREVNAGMILTGGPIFWANVIYSYSLTLMACVLFFQAFFRAKGLYRKQLGNILIGIGFTWMNSIIFLTRFNPMPGVDNTPFSFTVTGIIFAHALFRYRLLDVVPIARSMLVDNMSDGVVVLDSENRLVDLNPVARKMFPEAEIGISAEDIKRQIPDALHQYTSATNLRTELALENPDRYLDVQISAVQDPRQQVLGKLIVWRDITELKKLQLELRDLASRDSLTRAYNRRYFESLAREEWERSARHQHQMAIVLADIDHFKSINDTHGHQAGDKALVEFARLCLQTKRSQDLFARWGGEEFIFLLPETNLNAAVQFANRFCALVAQTPIITNDTPFQMTCSLGVSACIPPKDSLEDALRRADAALYEAKRSGRNRVVLRSLEKFTDS